MGHDWTYQTTQKASFPLYVNETYVGQVIVDEEWGTNGDQTFHVFTILDETVNRGRFFRFNARYGTALEAFQAVFDFGSWGIDVQERHHEPTPFDKVMSVLTDTWHSPEEAARRIVNALEAQ